MDISNSLMKITAIQAFLKNWMVVLNKYIA